MIDRIFGYRQSSSDPPVDCYECRMIGGGGLTALGAYVIYYSVNNRKTSGRYSTMLSSLVGTFVLSIGVLRITGTRLNSTPKTQSHVRKASDTWK